MNNRRESWKSKIGFTFAALGSAVGLANICIFPHLVGRNGGAAFIVIYLICLAVIGFPVFVSEILIGRTTQRNPVGAFTKLSGKPRTWGKVGLMTIVTSFIVTAFYSVLAGWILGYLFEALTGNLTKITTPEDAKALYDSLLTNPWWCLFFHGSFMAICMIIVYGGVRHGIERASKVLMPVLIFLLLIFVMRGVTLPGAYKGLKFLFSPDWSEITPAAIMIALGQSFFTLSLGQGTMVTYGSYLTKRDNVVGTCLPIALGDSCISICAAVAIFTTVFSLGIEPKIGLGLFFQTFPLVFSKLPGGIFWAILFFAFITLAAITSQISVMEPLIAYLIDEKGWKRGRAVIFCGLGAVVLGIPCALAFNILDGVTLGGNNIIDAVQFLSQDVMIPLGGLGAVLLVGWVWGRRNTMQQLEHGALSYYRRYPIIKRYLWLSIKYSAPVLITLIFLNRLIN
ncbi:MAG: sodium-dependent transporter [Chlamydiota bacterium]